MLPCHPPHRCTVSPWYVTACVVTVDVRFHQRSQEYRAEHRQPAAPAWSSSSRRPRPRRSPATWARVRRRGRARPCPRPAAQVPQTCRTSTRTSPGPASGVNVDDDFEPIYIVSPDRASTSPSCKGSLKDADELYLATDEDREGEAIAWHLVETLKPKVPGPADGVPRDHPAGDRSGGRQPAGDRPRPGRRPGGPAHPRPAVRLRGLPGAVEEGAAAACRPAGCSPWPPGSWSSGSAPGWLSAPPSTGTSPATLAVGRRKPSRRGRAVHRHPGRAGR